jgi:hypothetical protein|tara:strand:- start:345 stop:641 length:297 start_codon:yes stop_codon:yes gene_type:complete
MKITLVKTLGISSLIAAHGEFDAIITKCFQAHFDGIYDWFDEDIGVSSTLCDEDIKSNEDANLVKARILTSWKWAGIKFWIITDAGHEIITVLLPEEY